MNTPTTTSSAASPSLSSNKSKKSKSDILRSSCGQFLKQKCFVGSEKYRKSDFQLMQNKKQFAIQKMVESDLTNENSFTFSNVLCISNNQHIADQQFSKFTQFVEDQDDAIRFELRRFYAPLLCHMYLELLRAREGRFALDFLRKYSPLIAPIQIYDDGTPTRSIENHKDGEYEINHIQSGINFIEEAIDFEDAEQEYFTRLITALSNCSRIEETEIDPVVALFRTNKYEIHTSEVVINTLQAYLKRRGHVILMNLLANWFHIHLVDNEIKQWTEEFLFLPHDDDMKEECREQKQKSEKSSHKRTAEESIDNMKVEAESNVELETNKDKRKTKKEIMELYMKDLRQTREHIMKTQVVTPRFLKLNDEQKTLTTADLDATECHLVAGFNNSLIKIWQLSQSSTRGKNFYRSFHYRNCRWDLNHVDDQEEEEDSDSELEEPGGNKTKIEEYYSRKSSENSINRYGGLKMIGHDKGVTCVKFSKNHPIFYSTSKDTTIRTWKASTYSCNAIYRGHRYSVWCIDESPTGAYMATGSKDLTARLWCLERNYPLMSFIGHVQDIECLAFHPNGNYIATGSDDFSVRLWCVSSGKLMRVFNDCKQAVTKIAFSPDGKMLAVGGEESKVRIFDLAAGSQLNELKDHNATISGLAWSPNNKLLGTVCRDGVFRLWDVKKLIPYEGSSTSSSSSSSSSNTINRLISIHNKCESYVNLRFSTNESVCCIGN